MAYWSKIRVHWLYSTVLFRHTVPFYDSNYDTACMRSDKFGQHFTEDNLIRILGFEQLNVSQSSFFFYSRNYFMNIIQAFAQIYYESFRLSANWMQDVYFQNLFYISRILSQTLNTGNWWTEYSPRKKSKPVLNDVYKGLAISNVAPYQVLLPHTWHNTTR